MRTVRNSSFLVWLPFFLIQGSSPVIGGGPGILDGTVAAKWGPGPISVLIDNRGFGGLSSEEAASLVRGALSRWEALPDSSMDFQARVATSAILIPPQSFPSNAQILFASPRQFDDFFGDGASSTFFGIVLFALEIDRPEFFGVLVFLNGGLAGSIDLDVALTGLIGSMIGLGSTAVGEAQARSPSIIDNAEIPVMFPLVVPGMTPEPKRDDRAWAAWLYPEEDAQIGEISGTVQLHSGLGVEGAQVIAVPVTDTKQASSAALVGGISDFLTKGTGSYRLPGLPPGLYEVYTEPIPDDLIGAIPPFADPFAAFSRDYYNGSGESSDPEDDGTEKTVIEVFAGETVRNIDLSIANSRPTVTLSPPVPEDRLIGSDIIAVEGEAAAVRGSGSDPEGDELLLSWRQIQGPPVALSGIFTEVARFDAPAVDATEILAFELKVTDSSLSDTAMQRVAVVPMDGENTAPTVEAGDDRDVTPGAEITLSGTAVDPDGDELLITWTQRSGTPVLLQGERSLSPSILVSEGIEEQELLFELKANDARGGEATDEMSIRVEVNDAPIVLASIVPGATVKPFTMVTLHAEIEDPDGDPVTVQWSQTAGPMAVLSDPNAVETSFDAPFTLDPIQLDFRVTASDAELTGEAEVSVFVLPFSSVVVPAGLLPVTTDAILRFGGAEIFDRSFVGLGIVNSSDVPNPVTLEGLAANGASLFETALDPDLPAMGQLARLTTELVPDGFEPASLQFRGERGDLAGFFLVGDLLSQRLDGVGAGEAIQGRSYFLFARQGSEDQTLLHIHNPGSEPSSLSLQLFEAGGALSSQAQRNVPPRGSVFQSLRQIFGAEIELEDGYILMEASEAVSGVLLYGTRDHYSSIRALPAVPVQSLRIPQFFIDPAGGGTVLSLLAENISEATVQALDDQGTSIGTATIGLLPGQLVRAPLESLFPDLGQESLLTGHLEIRFPSPTGVLGAVSFVGSGERTRSMLPAILAGQLETAFLHVAQSPAFGIFTGLVVLNPGTEPSHSVIRAYDVSGAETASAEVDLAPGSRIVDLLNSSSYLGADFEQIGGHLRISSSQPVIAFALFGDFELRFLSAIEGRELK